jgi:hypothetical protein
MLNAAYSRWRTQKVVTRKMFHLHLAAVRSIGSVIPSKELWMVQIAIFVSCSFGYPIPKDILSPNDYRFPKSRFPLPIGSQNSTSVVIFVLGVNRAGSFEPHSCFVAHLPKRWLRSHPRLVKLLLLQLVLDSSRSS